MGNEFTRQQGRNFSEGGQHFSYDLYGHRNLVANNYIVTTTEIQFYLLIAHNVMQHGTIDSHDANSFRKLCLEYGIWYKSSADCQISA